MKVLLPDPPSSLIVKVLFPQLCCQSMPVAVANLKFWSTGSRWWRVVCLEIITLVQNLWVGWRPKGIFLRLRACFATSQPFQPSFTNDLDKKRHFLHIEGKPYWRIFCGNYFPTAASVPGSIDQPAKWVSGRGGEGGEKSIFQVFPIYTLLLRNQFAWFTGRWGEEKKLQPPSITANTDLVQRQKPPWLLVGQNGGGIVEDMI